MSEPYSHEYQGELWRAAQWGELGKVESLVEGGWAHPNTEYKLSSGGFLALCAASLNGHTEVALRLVALNADVNRAQSVADKNTPLHLAARNNKGETVGALLQAGARPDVRNGGGETPRERRCGSGMRRRRRCCSGRRSGRRTSRPRPARPAHRPAQGGAADGHGLHSGRVRGRWRHHDDLDRARSRSPRSRSRRAKAVGEEPRGEARRQPQHQPQHQQQAPAQGVGERRGRPSSRELAGGAYLGGAPGVAIPAERPAHLAASAAAAARRSDPATRRRDRRTRPDAARARSKGA